jgi:hypothetical protein
VIFNMPMCVLNVFWTIQDMSHDENGEYIYNFFKFDSPTYYLNNLVYCLCVPLNSLANPILYLCRIKRLREALIIQTMKLFGSSSSGTHVQLHSVTHTQHNLLARPPNIQRASSQLHHRATTRLRVYSCEPMRNSVDLGMMRRKSLEL